MVGSGTASHGQISGLDGYFPEISRKVNDLLSSS